MIALSEEDRIRLARGVRVTAGGLADDLPGRRYRLNRVGREVVRGLDGRHTLGHVTAGIAATYGINPAVVRTDVLALLDQLDEAAMLDVRRPRFAGARRLLGTAKMILGRPVALAVLLADGIPGQRPPARRYQARLAPLLLACVRSQAAIVTAFLVLALAAILFLVVRQPLPASQSLVVTASHAFLKPLLIAAAYVLILAAHECGHLVPLRLLGVPVHYVVVRGLNVGLCHAAASPHKQALVSAAGPLSALMAAFLITAYLVLFSGPLLLQQPDYMFPAILGLIHLAGLGPWSSDGRALWRRAPARDVVVRRSDALGRG